MTNLRAYLTRKNMTQAELATALGVSRSYVSQIVNGDRMPGLGLAIKIEQLTRRRVPVASWATQQSEAAK